MRRNRDLRQLLWHRHRLVQMRTRIMKQLHVVALNEGCAAGKRCGGRRVGRNWKGCRWHRGLADAARTCSPCSTS